MYLIFDRLYFISGCRGLTHTMYFLSFQARNSLCSYYAGTTFFTKQVFETRFDDKIILRFEFAHAYYMS